MMSKRCMSAVWMLAIAGAAIAQKVTVTARDAPAETVFAELMRQSGKNFVYPSDLLKGMKVSVTAKDEPLGKVLGKMFRNTDVKWKIKNNNVTLTRRKKRPAPKPQPVSRLTVDGFEPEKDVEQLEEVVVVSSRNKFLAHESPEIGGYNLTSSEIKSTPVVFGESDVIKSLQLQPGVAAGTEAMAGMYVHGGDADENLYMLDNVPLYQVNHFGGLFSAFNTEAIRNVDFYKSSFPAKYDGRLSSFMDVHTREGDMERHSGSFRLGLTSGAFSLSGPVFKGKTTYSVALRRSWYEVLSVPILALVNHHNDEHTDIRYAFMDANAKLNHHFSDRSMAFVSFYYGDDLLHGGTEDRSDAWTSDDKTHLRWGNLVASAGWNYVVSPVMFAEFTAAYTRFYSRMTHDWLDEIYNYGEVSSRSHDVVKSDNNINDWIFRANFDWRPAAAHKVNFGAGYTRHSFLPSRTVRTFTTLDSESQVTDSAWTYRANEFNLYAGDDWTLGRHWRVNAGAHFSLFNIDGHTRAGLSPRASVRYIPADGWAVKASYSRAYQYVHQLSQSFISLPTDQWLPITGDFSPQRSDKVSAGVYWLLGGRYSFSAEGYWKWLHNLIDYRDEYYLLLPQLAWDARLTTGRGTAKGLDFKVEKETGRVTGHVGYSLMWADRTFADRNGGKTYPARFDNRHKINVAVNWKINDRWELNAAWTGMSGNRVTFPTQMWQGPNVNQIISEVPLRTDLNNARLPFYHRLDLGLTRHTRRGYWTLSLYNAYCNMNVVSLRRGDRNGRPVFQQLRMLPLIPSFSYTWLF
ncbi:MAG: TonB-dependent receptor [Muribaculaceae bacterium]|nr:TonB-dependent receptor [Muribaculaceae bacterium]